LEEGFLERATKYIEKAKELEKLTRLSKLSRALPRNAQDLNDLCQFLEKGDSKNYQEFRSRITNIQGSSRRKESRRQAIRNNKTYDSHTHKFDQSSPIMNHYLGMKEVMGK